MSETIQDLHTAFLRCIRKPAPTSAKCRDIIRSNGWTDESAGRQLGIHPCLITRLLSGQHVSRKIRASISTLPSIPRKS